MHTVLYLLVGNTSSTACNLAATRLLHAAAAAASLSHAVACFLHAAICLLHAADDETGKTSGLAGPLLYAYDTLLTGGEYVIYSCWQLSCSTPFVRCSSCSWPLARCSMPFARCAADETAKTSGLACPSLYAYDTLLTGGE